MNAYNKQTQTQRKNQWLPTRGGKGGEGRSVYESETQTKTLLNKFFTAEIKKKNSEAERLIEHGDECNKISVAEQTERKDK